MKKFGTSSSYLILWSPQLLLFSAGRCGKLQFVVVVAVAVVAVPVAVVAVAVAVQSIVCAFEHAYLVCVAHVYLVCVLT